MFAMLFDHPLLMIIVLVVSLLALAPWGRIGQWLARRALYLHDAPAGEASPLPQLKAPAPACPSPCPCAWA